CAGIPQCNRDVPRPALVSYAVDGRAPHALLELACSPCKQRRQLACIECIANLEVRVRSRPGELVPWTEELAVIAAIDPVADCTPQFNRDGALVLYRQIRNAAPRVQLVRREDRPGWTGGHARLTAAAMRRGRLVHRERQVRQDLAKKEPRARV